MGQVVTSTLQWLVSARPGGEVLAARARGPGIELALLGAPPGFGLQEVESWLADLVGVAGETSRGSSFAPADPMPIPRLLHHALTGLLFYEAELWGEPQGRQPCGLAFVEGEGRVAFGWTGAGRVEVAADGSPLEPQWVLVRDEQGRAARAFLAEARCRLSVRASWTGAREGGEPAQSTVEAEWPGQAEATAASEQVQGLAAEAQGQRALVTEPSSEPRTPDEQAEAPLASRPRGFWRFRSWMDRLAGSRWKEQGSGPAPAEAEAAAESAPGPEPIAHDVPGVPELIPEPEPATQDLAPGGEASEATGQVAAAEFPILEPALVEERMAETPEPVPVEEPVVEAPVPVFALVEEPLAEAPEPEPAIIVGPAVAIPEPQPIVVVGPAVAGPGPEPALVVEAPLEVGEPAPTIFEASMVEPPVVESQPEVGAEAVAGAVTVEPATALSEKSGTAEAGASEAGPAARRLRVRRPAWPEPEEERRAVGRPIWQRPWFVATVVVALFGAGWLLGRLDLSAGRSSLGAMLKAIGLGPARYEVAVTSRPSGAWISVDGVEQARRTPATLELEPGAHQVVLSLSGEGGSAHTVRGKRGERVALDVELWGSLQVTAPEGSAPVAVMVDGLPRGYAPLAVDRLSPGIHRLQFSGPGIAPWEQTVEVHVNRTAGIVAQPVVSPATGLLEVRAMLADETGTEPLAGATVWIDGEPRGATPLKLEVARGPHSIRVRYRNEEAPVRVIDLPGGNQRFATFQLGLNEDHPRLLAVLSGRVPLDRPAVLSASLDRVREGDVREMWLHVRTPEGAWQRYPMSVMKATSGVVGVAVFPTTLFDTRGRTAWYVSASTPTGDEYFSEIQPAQAVTLR